MKFAIDHDFHIHSRLSICSDDPGQTPEAILAYARKNGLKKICLTDHLWDSTVCSFSGDHFYAIQNIPYIRQNLPLPQAPDVEFFFGCETEFDKNMRVGLTRENFDQFDFVIIPTTHTHMLGLTIDETDNTEERRAALYIQRLDALLDQDLPFEKIGIAHLTCCFVGVGNAKDSQRRVLNAIPDAELYRVFGRIAKAGAGFELNEDIFQYNEEELAAQLRYYRIAKECGCKFYLGSDAHTRRGLERAPAVFERILELTGLEESDKFRPLG